MYICIFYHIVVFEMEQFIEIIPDGRQGLQSIHVPWLLGDH